jgi:hypothetical protein
MLLMPKGIFFRDRREEIRPNTTQTNKTIGKEAKKVNSFCPQRFRYHDTVFSVFCIGANIQQGGRLLLIAAGERE